MNVNKVIAWIGVLVWMGLIFFLSHQPATESSELSSELTKMIMMVFKLIMPGIDHNIPFLHFIVRKAAHFFAYFILGILVIYALNKSSINKEISFSLAMFISVLYAISDEVHQLFIPGRSGQITDVLIDSTGAFVGIITYQLLSVIKQGTNEDSQI